MNLTGESLNGLKELKTLQITGSLITEIRADMWQGLDTLNEVDRSYSKIKNIQPGGFKYISSLTKLSLECTAISIITCGLDLHPCCN